MSNHTFQKLVSIDSELLSVEDLLLDITYEFVKGQKGTSDQEFVADCIEVEEIVIAETPKVDHGDIGLWKDYLIEEELETFCWENHETITTPDYGD